MLALSTPVATLRMVGPIYAARLAKLGIHTVDELLMHIPFRYENYTLISKIVNLQAGEKVSIVGIITSFTNIYTKHGKKIQKAKVADETGEIEVIWYNQPFLKNILKVNTKVSLAGKVNWFGHSLVFESPEYEFIRQTTDNRQQITNNLIHTAGLIPIYPETEGLSSKWLRSRINTILTKLSPLIPEVLPNNILSEYNLLGRREAIYFIHFPKTLEQAEEAHRRLSFDELITFQIATEMIRKQMEKKIVRYKLKIPAFSNQLDNFISDLPFELTSSQRRATAETLSDLSKSTPMNRLLEGDVGSGKTVVAAIAMYMTYLNGFQSVLMAPTEILANQHYRTIKTLLEPYGIKVALLTSSITTHNLELITHNHYDIFVGTHALLYDKLQIKNLALVVIDEQQRFGVEQRAVLREKGDNPHVLILTATPIPRTIALSFYADLNLSILSEMPKGRMKIKTWVVPNEKRLAAYNWIKAQLEESKFSQQAFIICPFIEESESLETVKAVKVEYKRLKTEVFPDLKLGLLHGKMKAHEKEKVMADLKNGKLDVLVSTPVVEVGIDIPTATIMMIEAAERFGLSQLHQLRGRVGRGNLPSYCLLFTESEDENIIKRLKILEKVFSGPELAEYDLKLRGMGEIFGTRQHGFFGFKIADLTDLILLEECKEAANLLMTNDQSLSNLPLLKEEVQKYTIKKIAPD